MMSTAFTEPETHHEPVSHTGRHPVHVAHLVMGVAFLGLFVVWLVVGLAGADIEDVRWLLPLPWLAAGAAGLVGTAVRRRKP